MAKRCKCNKAIAGLAPDYRFYLKVNDSYLLDLDYSSASHFEVKSGTDWLKTNKWNKHIKCEECSNIVFTKQELHNLKHIIAYSSDLRKDCYIYVLTLFGNLQSINENVNAKRIVLSE